MRIQNKSFALNYITIKNYIKKQFSLLMKNIVRDIIKIVLNFIYIYIHVCMMYIHVFFHKKHKRNCNQS